MDNKENQDPNHMPGLEFKTGSALAARLDESIDQAAIFSRLPIADNRRIHIMARLREEDFKDKERKKLEEKKDTEMKF